MAKYEIEGPDGHTYEIEAPEDATPEQVADFAKTHLSGMADEPKNRNWLDTLASASKVGLKAIDGMTLGAAPYIQSAMGAPIAKGIHEAAAAMGGPKAPSWKEEWDAAQRFNRGERKDAEENFPIASGLAELGGAVGSAVALSPIQLAKSIAEAPTLAGRIAKAAPVAGAAGFVSGALNNEGDVTDKLKAGAGSGILSMGMTPIAVAGGEKIAKIAGKAYGKLAKYLPRIGKDAQDVVVNATKDGEQKAKESFGVLGGPKTKDNQIYQALDPDTGETFHVDNLEDYTKNFIGDYPGIEKVNKPDGSIHFMDGNEPLAILTPVGKKGFMDISHKTIGELQNGMPQEKTLHFKQGQLIDPAMNPAIMPLLNALEQSGNLTKEGDYFKVLYSSAIAKPLKGPIPQGLVDRAREFDKTGKYIGKEPLEKHAVPDHLKEPSPYNDSIRISKGDREQNQQMQAFESSALKGGKGQKAQEMAESFREGQQADIKKRFSMLMGENAPQSTDEVMNPIVDKVQQEAIKAKAEVKAAYMAASAGPKSQQLKISNDAMRKFSKRARSLISDDFDPREHTRLNNLLGDLDESLKQPLTPKTGQVSTRKIGQTITDLEKWRKRVTNASRDLAGDPKSRTEKMLIDKVKQYYDGYLQNVGDEAIMQGDKSAIDAFRAAGRQRAEFGKLYESDKVVNRLVTSLKDQEPLTVREVSNMVFGADQITGKKESLKTIKAITAAAKDPEGTTQKFKQGILMRVLKDAESAQEIDKVGNAFISPAKLNTNLKQLLEDKELVNHLFNPKEVANLHELQKTINLISSKKPGSVNNSNSFEKLAQLWQGMSGIPILSVIPKATNAALKEPLDQMKLGKMLAQVSDATEKHLSKTAFASATAGAQGTSMGVNSLLNGGQQ